METPLNLTKLLDNGITNNLEQLDQQEQCRIEDAIMEMNYADEHCLALVYEFVTKEKIKGNIKDDYRDKGKNYYCIGAFCRDYILNKGIFEKIESHKNRERYNKDYSVLASIQCYNKQYSNQSDSERKEYTDQVWFLLQFLIYYVEALTSNRPKTMPNALQQLQSFVKIVSGMDFYYKDNWINGRPKYNGELVLEIKRDDVKGEDKKITIADSRILHLVSILIQGYLDDPHNKQTIESLNGEQLVKTKEGTLFEHFSERLVKDGWRIIHDKKNRTEEEQLLIDNIKDVLPKDFYERSEEERETSKIALLKHFVFDCLGKSATLHYKNVNEFYPNYDNEKENVNTGEWSLFSRMIYILKYYPLTKLNKYLKKLDTCTPDSFNKLDTETSTEHEKRVKEIIDKIYKNSDSSLFKMSQTIQKQFLFDNIFNVLLELYYPSRMKDKASEDPLEEVYNLEKSIIIDSYKQKYQKQKTETIKDLIERNKNRKEHESSDEYGVRMNQLYDALLKMMIDAQAEKEYYDIGTINDITIKNLTKTTVSDIDKNEKLFLDNINRTRTLNI